MQNPRFTLIKRCGTRRACFAVGRGKVWGKNCLMKIWRVSEAFFFFIIDPVLFEVDSNAYNSIIHDVVTFIPDKSYINDIVDRISYIKLGSTSRRLTMSGLDSESIPAWLSLMKFLMSYHQRRMNNFQSRLFLQKLAVCSNTGG